MAKFRKKPVVIEAMLFTNEAKNRVFNWVTGDRAPAFDAGGSPVLKIETLEGTMTAVIGDWIIKGVEGEFYPCKPSVFDATYDMVAE